MSLYKRALSFAVALALICIFALAHAADDSGPNEEALSAADAAEIPDGLSKSEASIYRQGFAMGYYAALHPVDTLDEYVLNTNSKKFHYPSCQSAASIAPENRQVFHGSKDEVIAQGYKPCGLCKP